MISPIVVWLVAMLCILISWCAAYRMTHDGLSIKRNIIFFTGVIGTFISMFVLLWGVLAE